MEVRKQKTYAIIAVGYNRPYEMKRLLNSICDAEMGDLKADLIISLDYSDRQDELKKIATKIEWRYGRKEIRAFPNRQGLRNHILQCGDLTSDYDAVVVLEDDIVVAKGFMQYVNATVEQYSDDNFIAGISLYTHQTNQGNGRFFEAQYNGFDAFMMQCSQSWGQCWTKKMWKSFRVWYMKQAEELTGDELFPDYIARWNKQSWLKYHMKYTVETHKYHVYPYFSLSTNFSSAGEHSRRANSAYQVPLQCGVARNYRFPTVAEAIKYDAFFERQFDEELWNGKYGKVLLDLYGLRKHFGDADTLASVNLLPYSVIKKIGLNYRPIEQNLLSCEEGKGIYLYDLHHEAKPPKNNIRNELSDYEFRAQNWRMTLQHGVNKLKLQIKSKLS